jgi:malonyl-CoA O-methyltransferase
MADISDSARRDGPVDPIDPLDPLRAPMRTETVRRQFDRRAPRFAQTDFLAREVDRRLLERLDLIRLAPRRVADLGCAAGGSRGELQRRFPQAQWLGVDHSLALLRQCAPADSSGGWKRWLWPRRGGAPRAPRAYQGACVAADAGALPFADGSIDLVYSNLMLHWHPRPHRLFAEWRRVLRDGGVVVFSCFGPDTIKELRAASARALPRAVPMPFVDMHDFGDMLVAEGFGTPVVDSEMLRLTYSDPRALLRDVIALGGNPREDRARGLPGGRRARALLTALTESAEFGATRRAGSQSGRIGLTFEIIYGHAWRGQRARPGAGATAIAVNTVRQELRYRVARPRIRAVIDTSKEH